MSRIIFLLEGRAEKEFLDTLLPRLFPGLDFLCIPHEGKQDLERSIPRKLRGWRILEDQFVILRDKDAADCRVLKAGLVKLCHDAGRPNSLVRIACHELEAWYLGDPVALASAFNRPAIGRIRDQKKFREPDRLQRPAEEIERLCPDFQKISGARAVARQISYARNSSNSFRAFIDGVARITTLLPSPSV
jgi:hypothetical protein